MAVAPVVSCLTLQSGGESVALYIKCSVAPCIPDQSLSLCCAHVLWSIL